jgi:alanyl-tRNA synthetase
MSGVNEIRATFLNYFARNGHEIVASSSLVPRNDPTLMFANSGMVQFKNVFTGLEQRPYRRATTAQKCVRAGGKHNDLDNVGYTARHHTFFEMLGNFSFGDYFKPDAIAFAWELITKEFALPKDRLSVTVYSEDGEARALWKKIAGLPDSRIIPIATSDNFWRMGDIGPCGPCSEIFYDHGDHIWGGPPGSAEQDGDRFIEIWNLVFMQYEEQAGGVRSNLPRPSIDTGMGLERISAVLQGTHDNYETDTMRALVRAVADVVSSEPDGPMKASHRVIADHLRATSFLIADGVLPSNEGRGYVLRRIMRRAMRHLQLLGARDAVMFRLVPALVREMGQAYPELTRAESLIAETLKIEEQRFRRTLERGLSLLDEETAGMDEGSILKGEAAFKLYDTFGFPLDLTQDALRNRKISVDLEGFQQSMARQKAQARAAWAGTGEAASEAVWFGIKEEHGATEFLGYETETAEGVVAALVADGILVDSLSAGQSGFLVVNQTPFYAESGGQMGDRGIVTFDGGFADVTDVKKRLGDVFVHAITVREGQLKVGRAVQLNVDHTTRSAIRANHSATHVLHEALRQVLGDHVAQKGSLVSSERLRFDISHQKPISDAEIAGVETIANGIIVQNSAVQTRLMAVDDAIALGARALFGEKYGDEVRVVSMGENQSGERAGEIFSIELCGGTHVTRTGDIGLVVVVAEGAVSAGVRRIEALTGAAARHYLGEESARLKAVAAALRVPAQDAVERVQQLVDEKRKLEKELAEAKRKLASAGDSKVESAARFVGSVPFLGRIVDGVDGKDLKQLVDDTKASAGAGIVAVIGRAADGKASVVIGVTPEWSGKISAVDLVRVASIALGGKGGGGRSDFAQAGGPDASKADEAMTAIEQLLRTLG